jgi:hypothetical protein
MNAKVRGVGPALALTLVFALVAVSSAQAVVCETDALNLLLQNDGEVGMYLKRVNGPVLGGYNESTVFEPASAIKVLIHAHALRQVQDGLITLDTGIDWVRDLDEDECGSHPCNPTDPQAENDPLEFLLSEMMTCSDNRHTDALRNFFTDEAILETAASLGMADTDFNHIIGCPSCDSFNEITLVDLGRLYEGVANGFLDETHQQLFHDLMLNETNSGFINTLNTIVDEEVANADKDPQVAADFKALIRYATKGGSYTFLPGCGEDADSLFRSSAGILELPINNGVTNCEYVFGAWMNGVPEVVQSTGTVAAELIRLAICEALQTWDIIATNEITRTFNPPEPWGKDGLIITGFTLTAETDLSNLRFLADALQCSDVPCEPGMVKKISADHIEFVPPEVAFVPAGEDVDVEVKITIPVGQHACDYVGKLHAISEVEGLCIPKISEAIDVTVEVLPEVDYGVFTIINPNSETKNADPADGPGNIRIEPDGVTVEDLVKIGDPNVFIPSDDVLVGNLNSLAAGEAQDVTVSVFIPDGIPVNATYTGRVIVVYERCTGGPTDSDTFTIQLNVLPTQGTLDIVEASVAGDFCPDDPWTMQGHVEFSFDVHANGDHRNIRVASGGLRHESLDKKLDDFNFFPEEIAFLAAGETRTINVITKIPIGQHTGSYSDYFRIVSESGGEDSVSAGIDICSIYDMDIKDHYANLGDNIMEIQAISRSNQSGGEWALRAFDIGLPDVLVNNHDEFDGPGNSPITCITCEFAEWSPLWHEDDHGHHFHENMIFTGTASVLGDSCGWSPGEFRRMLVGLFVPPMQGGENGAGTYKGRLDCWALADADTVGHDYFDIEVQLARIVGSMGGPGSFGAYPAKEGALIYWGDFTGVGLTGKVNLYREDPNAGGYVRVNQAPLGQNSEYLDTEIGAEAVYNYKLGIDSDGSEVLIGPLSVGSAPRSFQLSQNSPNPFNERTIISYQLPLESQVSLKVYDLTGRLVRTLRDSEEPAGFYTVAWDRKDESGRAVANGIYFYRLETPGFEATKKMILLK